MPLRFEPFRPSSRENSTPRKIGQSCFKGGSERRSARPREDYLPPKERAAPASARERGGGMMEMTLKLVKDAKEGDHEPEELKDKEGEVFGDPL